MPPVVELSFEDFAPQPVSLPRREVSVLDVKLREQRRPAGGKRRIEIGQLPKEDTGGPGVAHDVVIREEKDVALRSQSEEAHPQDRPGGEIERPLGFELGDPHGLPLALAVSRSGHILRLETEIAGGADLRHNAPFPLDEP